MYYVRAYLFSRRYRPLLITEFRTFVLVDRSTTKVACRGIRFQLAVTHVDDLLVGFGWWRRVDDCNTFISVCSSVQSIRNIDTCTDLDRRRGRRRLAFVDILGGYMVILVLG